MSMRYRLIMEQKHRFNSCHITTNRACNLRCSWCYAKDTNFDTSDNMSFDTFKNIISFCNEAQIKSIVLIGGEPTVYPDIFNCLDYLKGKYKVTLVTNGVALSDYNVCKKYIDSGVTRFSVSIKSDNSADYLETTGFDCFGKVLKAIGNLKDLNARFSVSYVVTNDNVDSIIPMVEVVSQAGCDAFFFSFCRNFNVNGHKDKEYIDKNNPFDVAKKFENILPIMKEKIPKFSYAINDPLCVFSDEFIQKYLIDFYYPCYLHDNTSITFDTDGSLIPCNTIHNIKVGKICADFNTLDEYLAFENSEKYLDIYKKLRGYPSVECFECKYFKFCQGRCVCNWTNYSFEELKQMRKEYFKNNDDLVRRN